MSAAKHASILEGLQAQHEHIKSHPMGSIAHNAGPIPARCLGCHRCLGLSFSGAGKVGTGITGSADTSKGPRQGGIWSR